MDQELVELIEERVKIEAIMNSARDVERGYLEKVKNFMERNFDLKDGDKFNLLDIVQRARK